MKNKLVIDLCALFFILRTTDIEMITSVFKKLLIINRIFLRLMLKTTTEMVG